MPPIKVVYAVADCGSETSDGLTINLKRGDCWAADDPFVLGHAGLFSPEPIPRRTVPAPIVEQATHAPGERRSTRRG